jgi:hypothetical protein
VADAKYGKAPGGVSIALAIFVNAMNASGRAMKGFHSIGLSIGLADISNWLGCLKREWSSTWVITGTAVQ